MVPEVTEKVMEGELEHGKKRRISGGNAWKHEQSDEAGTAHAETDGGRTKGT